MGELVLNKLQIQKELLLADEPGVDANAGMLCSGNWVEVQAQLSAGDGGFNLSRDLAQQRLSRHVAGLIGATGHRFRF